MGGDREDQHDGTSLDRGRLRSLLVLLCGALGLVVAGNSALAIALPGIAADLVADQAQLTWVVDAYALTFAALLLPAGIAADRWGRRTLLVAGLLVFGGAALASAFAPDVSSLIALRALAGVGAAAVFPVTLSALVDAYPESRRSFAVAVWSGVSAAGAVIGTLVAGALLERFWWGSVQLAFGVLVVVAVPGVLVLVAQNRDARLSLDPLGALWSVVALVALVYGVVRAPEEGWLSPSTVLTLLVAAAALAAFVVHELRSAAPSLDVRAFRDRGLTGGALLVALQFFASLALFVLAPQYLQIVRGLSPLQAAAALLVIPVGVGAGTALAPPALARLGARAPGAAGLGLMALGFGVLALGLQVGVGTAAPWWALAVGLVLFGVGFGLSITPGTVLILDGLPAERRSVASAINDLTREVGGVLGIAVLSSVLIGSYRSSVAPTAATSPPELAAAVTDGAGAALGAAAPLGEAGRAIADAAREAFASGLADALWVGAGVLAGASLLCLALIPRGTTPLTAGEDADAHEDAQPQSTPSVPPEPAR